MLDLVLHFRHCRAAQQRVGLIYRGETFNQGLSALSNDAYAWVAASRVDSPDSCIPVAT